MMEKVSVGLKAENPKTAKCYLRPKIHQKGNTGRPVMCQSHVKYTKDFLQTLNQIEEMAEDG